MSPTAPCLRRHALAALTLAAACWGDLRAAPPAAVTPSAAPAAVESPWHARMSLVSSLEAVGVGRKLGQHYLGLGLRSVSFSSREGFGISPVATHELRFRNPHLPYLGTTAGAAYSHRDGLGDAFVAQTLGYEWRFYQAYMQVQVGVATPMGRDFAGRFWMPLGIGISAPF